MFHAFQSSENIEQSEMLRALFNQPGLQVFSFVELPLNTLLFHLDVAPVDHESRWQRFVFDNIENVFRFSSEEQIWAFRIYIQTKRRNNADYRLKRVVEIMMGESFEGESVFLFVCADGTTEMSSLSDYTCSEIINQARVWKEPTIAE